jgi:tRNA(Ile)-lysidine synthase
VGVAVSGGADSVALFRLLLEVREELGFVLAVAHFNHLLRGKASDAEERFVAKLAKQHGLEFFVDREDVSQRAKRERANLEDVARRARYAFFARLVHEGRIARVAVAHTADDQAETVLAHILRGTGLAGLGGIHPQAGVVFRPLLGIRRGELRTYLRAKRQLWREDATNQDMWRTRARIRRKLLPLLEKKFQPATVAHLCRLAELAREDEAYLESQTEALRRRSEGRKRDEVSILLAEFVREPLSLKTRLLRQVIEGVKPHEGQVSAAHIEAVIALAEHPAGGKSLDLPGGIEVLRGPDALLIRKRAGSSAKTDGKTPEKAYAYEVHLRSEGAELHIVELSTVLRLKVIDWPPEGRETKFTGAVLDRGRLGVPLVVRNWRPGDAMQPLNHQEPHKLARLLNENGVSRWDKELWPVLTSGGKCAWTRGLPVDVKFGVDKRTKVGVVITEEREP